MKVFSPAQARTANEERIAKDALRAKNVAEVTQELLQTKADVEKEFEETMARQRLETEEFFNQTNEKKRILEREVLELEERRKQALMPPLIKAEDIHSISEALHARGLELDYRESENEEDSRVLMRRLNEVAEQQQSLDERDARVKRLEKSTEAQRVQTAQGVQRLNKQMEDFRIRVEEKETVFAFKQSEMDAKENLLDEREKGFVARETEIQNAVRLLADHRLLLEKGFIELRQKQQKHVN